MAKQRHILHRHVNNDFLIGIVLGIVISVMLMGIFMATFKKKIGDKAQWYLIEEMSDTTNTVDSY